MDKVTFTVQKPVKGQQYHVRWQRIQHLWQCTEVNEEKKTVELSTKDRKKKIADVAWSDLRHTNRNALLNPH